MNQLFGERVADRIRARILGLSSKEREEAILAEINKAIEEDGTRKAFRFAFEFQAWDRTSHYIILVTKHALGRKVMKDIMAKESSEAPQGVPNYAFRPAKAQIAPVEPAAMQLGFFAPIEPPQPLEILGDHLVRHFAGRTVTFRDLCHEYDQIDDKYLERNYRDALAQLEAAGRVNINPPAGQRRLRNGVPTLPKWVQVTFPPRSD